METAKANDINIYHYIALLLERLSSAEPSDEVFEGVCPWNPEIKEKIQKRIDSANEN